MNQLVKVTEARQLDARWRQAFARQQANDTPQRARDEVAAWNALRDGRASLGLCLDPYCYCNYPCPVHDWDQPAEVLS